MVCRLDPANCFCGVCDGGKRAPEGYFGGTYCPCVCHSLKGQELVDYLAKNKSDQETALQKALEGITIKNKL